jgi:hypothetical protein
MAQAYVTSRGKNKKHKAKDQGKDSRNNAAMKLNQDLVKALAPTEDYTPRVLKIAGGGGLIGSKSSGAGAGSSDSRLKAERERLMRALAERSCAGPDCPTKASRSSDASADTAASLKKCPCQLAAYCSTECQKKHWEDHKDTCKERRKEMALADAAAATAAAK